MQTTEQRIQIDQGEAFLSELKKQLAGEVRADWTSRLLYSTDASIYQILPLAVAFPKHVDDLAAAVSLANAYQVPVLARGAGTSLAGQAVGPGLVLDCSRYLTKILQINAEERQAVVEPGVILEQLNRQLLAHGLMFGPDPASAERATIGGCVANNASGAHSIRYGMAADHLLAAEVVLSNGEIARWEEMQLGEAALKGERTGSREAAILRSALEIREKYAEDIRTCWPRTWRRASGYNLNYLLPWSPSQPAQWSSSENRAFSDGVGYPPVRSGNINLAPLLGGSEGTLAVIQSVTLNLVPRPKHTILGVLAYPDIFSACEAVPGLLETQPSAIELIPDSLIRLAGSVPAYAGLVSFVNEIPQRSPDSTNLLVLEYSGDSPAMLLAQARALGSNVWIAESGLSQRQVWAVRKVGLGILSSRAGDLKPISFIEDLTVPVEHLGHYVREMSRILEAHGTTGDFYAHASAGCLHMRPLLNLKDPVDVQKLRQIAREAVELVVSLGGAVTGEHGDGLARSEWLERAYGPRILGAFEQLKQAADPENLLNPGKIIAAPRSDQFLRYGQGYVTKPWPTVMDFSRQDGLAGAIEMCNGAGVCRKTDGVMCPSFQVTGEEMHSTRGRANLLRALIAGQYPSGEQAEEAVQAALDLCLACKGCQAECPSAVDMARLKYEFLEQYYEGNHRRKLRDYLFGYIDRLAGLGKLFPSAANRVLTAPFFAPLRAKFGLARQRVFPRLTRRSLRQLWKPANDSQNAGLRKEVYFLSDAFTEYFQPEVGLAALKVLDAAGFAPLILSVTGSGRTLLSKGFVRQARRHARRLLQEINRRDPAGRVPVVGVEPSEIYTLRDEFLDLLPGDDSAKSLSRRAYMLDEFLLRQGHADRPLDIWKPDAPETPLVLLHGHCYQKAQPPMADGLPVGMTATQELLAKAGYRVSLVDSGCCGMAGSFGYEAEHYTISMQIGEQALFPAVRQAPENSWVAASGVSCSAQIEDGTQRSTVHPVELLAMQLKENR